jgi:[CysO sulfur-carrier protein]-S-L-cysteine hydrolase
MMTLLIDRTTFDSMVAHLQSVLPLEGCGLLAGRGDRVERLYPVENRLRSAAAYEMEPGQLIAAFTALEGGGLSLLAIYHSHPTGPAAPSPTDIGRANYPEAAHVIVSFEEADRPQAGAFRIVDGRVLPLTLKVV